MFKKSLLSLGRVTGHGLKMQERKKRGGSPIDDRSRADVAEMRVKAAGAPREVRGGERTRVGGQEGGARELTSSRGETGGRGRDARRNCWSFFTIE